MLYNSCAFIVLSGSVMHEDVWSKWRAAEKPDNWKIMTKVEHTKRTTEYVALLERQKQKPKSTSKPKIDKATLPAIVKPAVLAQNVEVVPEYTEAIERPKAKRKRNRKKGPKGDHGNDDEAGTTAEVTGDDEPKSKRRG